DVAAREHRRPAELGLSLLLAARCHLDAARFDEHWLLRRGARLATVAAARGRRQPRSDADHVRARRRAAAAREGADLAVRLCKLAPGPYRQRCARANSD